MLSGLLFRRFFWKTPFTDLFRALQDFRRRRVVALAFLLHLSDQRPGVVGMAEQKIGMADGFGYEAQQHLRVILIAQFVLENF